MNAFEAVTALQEKYNLPVAYPALALKESGAKPTDPALFVEAGTTYVWVNASGEDRFLCPSVKFPVIQSEFFSGYTLRAFAEQVAKAKLPPGRTLKQFLGVALAARLELAVQEETVAKVVRKAWRPVKPTGARP